jgi:hypothetical protein
MEIQDFSREVEVRVLYEVEVRVHVSEPGERTSSIHGSPKRCSIHAANEMLVLWDGHVHRCRVSMDGLECETSMT